MARKIVNRKALREEYDAAEEAGMVDENEELEEEEGEESESDEEGKPKKKAAKAPKRKS